MIALQLRGNPNWKWSRKNNFSNCIVVRCGNEAGANPLCGMRAFTHLWNYLAPKPGSHRQRDRATIKVDSEQRGRGMPNIDRDGVKIHYEVHGDGPPLILTHGYSSTSAMWQGQVEALSRHHKLILWDMRGHGRSDYPDEA